MEAFWVAVVIIVAGMVYFAPVLIARGHPHRAAIFVVNLFFGWTLMGWVGWLAWALIRPRRSEDGS